MKTKQKQITLEEESCPCYYKKLWKGAYGKSFRASLSDENEG